MVTPGSKKSGKTIIPSQNTTLKIKRLQGKSDSPKLKINGGENAQIVPNRKTFFDEYFKNGENKNLGHRMQKISSTQFNFHTNPNVKDTERFATSICDQPTTSRTRPAVGFSAANQERN